MFTRVSNFVRIKTLFSFIEIENLLQHSGRALGNWKRNNVHEIIIKLYIECENTKLGLNVIITGIM